MKSVIPFDDIHYITTYNHEIRNTILIKPAGRHGYIYRSTLSGIQKQLPDYFVKVKDYQIINIKKVTHCIDDRVLFIGDECFEVSENCQALVHKKNAFT